MFEQAGITTVNIGLVRGQLETSKPPRALYVEFPLGRPLGRPDDVELQTAVLTTALELTSRDDGPFIVDYPEVIAEEGDEPASCPMPPRHDPDLHPAIDEARGIRNAYQRNVDTTGRTLLGRVASPDVDGVVTLIEQVIRLESGERLDDIGWDSATAIAAGQDIRAYYEEAGLQLADNVVGARSLESWFYSATEAGQLIRRAQKVMKEQGTADDFVVQYILPGTQAR
ncbi:MAG: hypothetical protein AAFY28_07895 [Actinomycetota bacterium]